MKTVQHPGLILSALLKESGIARPAFAKKMGVPFPTLAKVCMQRQEFPVWLCKDLADAGMGTRAGWLARVRNYEYYLLDCRWEEIHKQIKK